MIATQVISRMGVAALLLAFSSFVFGADKDRVDKVSNKDFAATVKGVETAVQKSGFIIVATVDHQNSPRGAKTVVFGPAAMGMPMVPETGLELPASFYVWERGDGKTVVSYRKPSGGFSTYGKEMVTKMGNDMDGMWAMMVEDATK